MKLLKRVELLLGKLASKLHCRRVGHKWLVEGRTVRNEGAVCGTCGLRVTGEAAMALWRKAPETDADVLNTYGIGEEGLDNYVDWPPAEREHVPTEFPTERAFTAKMAAMMVVIDWNAVGPLTVRYLEGLNREYGDSLERSTLNEDDRLIDEDGSVIDDAPTRKQLRAWKPTQEPRLSNPVKLTDTVAQAARNFAVRELCHQTCAKHGVFHGHDIMAFTAYVFENAESIIMLPPEGTAKH